MVRKVTLPLEGGCQCGAVRYQITEPPIMIYACHCTNCQRVGGSAFGLPVTITEDALKLTSGKLSEVAWESDSGNQRFGSYCDRCGCRIAHGQKPSNGILSLRAGTLDDMSWVAPAAHTWTKSAQPWVKFKADEILWDEQPTDYVPIIEKFKAAVEFE